MTQKRQRRREKRDERELERRNVFTTKNFATKPVTEIGSVDLMYSAQLVAFLFAVFKIRFG